MSPHFGSLVTAVESQVKHLGLIFNSENLYKVFTIWSIQYNMVAVCAVKHVGSSVLYHCCIQ